MNVLSLFDGISCARVALDRVGLPVASYTACEIEKNAIKVSTRNYPDIIRAGSVVGYVPGKVDLLIGGSPCQDLSIAKKGRKGLDGNRSCLFWEYLRIKKESNPTWFVLENVASMPKADRDTITREMGVEPIIINSCLVSAQSRKRLFWTNIPGVIQPKDRGILLRHILESTVDDKFNAKGVFSEKIGLGRGEIRTLGCIGNSHQANRVYDIDRKMATLCLGSSHYIQHDTIRKLTPVECERLQSLPDGYTECVATMHRYKCIGNAFNVDVVAHLLSYLLPTDGVKLKTDS